MKHSNRFLLSGISQSGTPQRSGPNVSQDQYIRWLLERLSPREEIRRREFQETGLITDLFLAIRDGANTEFYPALIEFGDLEDEGPFVVFLPGICIGAPPIIFPGQMTMCFAGVNEAKDKLVTAPFGNPGCELMSDPRGTVFYYRTVQSSSTATSHWQTDVRLMLKLMESSKDGWRSS